MKEPQDDGIVDDLDDFPQDPDEPIIWGDKDKYKPPLKYTEEAVIDGQKVTVYVEEFHNGIEKVV